LNLDDVSVIISLNFNDTKSIFGGCPLRIHLEAENMKHRLISLVLAALLTLSLAGCGRDNTEDVTDDKSPTVSSVPSNSPDILMNQLKQLNP
jgi:hypothetical protein